MGVEPTICGLQDRCITNYATEPFGVGKGIRTPVTSLEDQYTNHCATPTESWFLLRTKKLNRTERGTIKTLNGIGWRGRIRTYD